jgi:hypothetical protein
MRFTRLLLVTSLALVGGEVLAQEAPPPALELPLGAPVRLRLDAARGGWVEGVLADVDSRSISLLPREAPPLGANPLRLPSTSITRLEVLTGKKRQWLPGLLIGAAVGLAMGIGEKVDPVRCQFDEYTFCSRGAAVATMTGSSAFLGALIGGMVKTDIWTPVALDALGPLAPRGPRTSLRVGAARGGAGAQLSVSF